MNPLVAKLALAWVAAERADAGRRGEPMPEIPKQDELAIAADRVYAVMSGEVPWSQCSAGDRAIWRGRFRDLHLFEQLWNDDDRAWLLREAQVEGPTRGKRGPRAPRAPGASGQGALRPNYPSPQYPGGPPANAQPLLGPMGIFGGDQAQAARPRDRERVEHRDAVFYDTITAGQIIDWTHGSWRLFGNPHIGHPHLCNLQLGGIIADRDQTAHILGIWIWPTTTEGLLHVANRWRFTVDIGATPVFGPIHARELFQGYAFQRPLLVESRQNFSVKIDRDHDVPVFKSDVPIGDLWDLTFCVQCVVSTRGGRR